MSKHVAKILLYIEVHEYENNEPTENLLNKKELEEYNLSSKKNITISGFDKNDCLTKLNKWLNNHE